MKQINVPQSGSQASTTASRNRFGQYLRNRRAPVNVNSVRQQEVRASFAAGSLAWAELTEVQRDAWRTYASGITRTDSLGQSINLTGFQTFVGQYTLNLDVGIAAPTAPPAGDTPNIATLGFGDTTAAGFSAEVGVVTPTPMPFVQVFSSPPMSPGRNFNNDYRLIHVADGIIADGEVLAAADLIAKWGTLSAGMKFFVKCVPVSATGIPGAPVFGQVILT